MKKQIINKYFKNKDQNKEILKQVIIQAVEIVREIDKIKPVFLCG